MPALVKAFLIGAAIVVPVTIISSVIEPSRGVVAVVTTVMLSVCALITVKLYAAEIDKR